MIDYQTADSPFYEANKSYCEAMEAELKSLNVDCTGFCNSYGYELEATLQKGSLTFLLKLHKHQSVQKGFIVPKDAIDYAGVEIRATGFTTNGSVAIGQSGFRRMFLSRKWKDKIPAPYFISFDHPSGDGLMGKLIKIILENDISTFKIKNGKMVCIIHQTKTDPFELISIFENIINDWKLS